MKNQMRYALLMGSNLKIVESMPDISKAERDNNLSMIHDCLKDLGSDSFGWTGKNSTEPKILRNPFRHKLLSEIESAFEKQSVSNRDLFLFYYFGHGYIGPANQLTLAFKNKRIVENPENFSLQSVFDAIAQAGFKKIVLITDCCHAGVAADSPSLQVGRVSYYLMTSTDSGWTKTGIFTSELTSALRHPRAASLRSPGQDAITFKTWFDVTEDRLGTESCRPLSSGSLGGEILTSYELKVNEPFNENAPTKSLYNKLYHVLRLLAGNPMSAQKLHDKLAKQKHAAFTVVSYHNGVINESIVKVSTLEEYLRTLHDTGMTVEENGVWTVTKTGKLAIDGEGACFNQEIVSGVFHWLEFTGLDRSKLNKMLYALACKAIMPTVSHIEREMLREGFRMMRRKDLRIAFRVLAYAGVILRAVPDTYFPK